MELGAGRMGGNTDTKSGAPGVGPTGSATSMQSIQSCHHWVVVQEHWECREARYEDGHAVLHHAQRGTGVGVGAWVYACTTHHRAHSSG